jgi:subtilisin family serine protease
MAVEHGVVVVASAGNFGNYDGKTLYGAIASPGISPYVITVGAADTHGTAVRSDDTVAAFSSRGPTLWDGLPKPDLIAPGTDVAAAMSDDGVFYKTHPEITVDPCDELATKCENKNPEYMVLSGTSMAAPVVTGTVALMLEANPSLTPNAIKALLMASAQELPGVPYIEQGAGLVNVEGAVRLAASIGDLEEIQIGEEWMIEEGDLEPVSVIAGEEVAWSQGIGWTGFTLDGWSLFAIFQPAYSVDAVWGMGIGWTGISFFGYDPVFYTSILKIWASSLVDPMSLPLAGMNVLVGQSLDWMNPPEFLGEENPAFPKGE